MQLELVNRDSGSHHTVIQVIGIGGGGSNAVQRMIESGLEDVEFIMANTDLQALERFQSPKARILPLGEKITGGLGAGGNPEIGREAAEEDMENIREILTEAHMVFVTAGMGGGTGTGAAPIIARAAKEMGKLCVAVVTTPFHFEGQRKYELALQGLEELRKVVDTLIVIPNQLLLQVLDTGTSVREAFMNADEVLRMGVKGIADLITQPGDINVDFNDVCTVMRDGGKALMGIGICNGEDRAGLATRQALENPLLSGSEMQGATGLLVQITADETFSLEEYSIIMDSINAYVDTMTATVISGIAIDSQKKDEIKVTVIATGFHGEEELQNVVNPQSQNLNRSAKPSNTLRGYKGSGMQNPLQAPLSTPMSKPSLSATKSTGQSRAYVDHRAEEEAYREAGQAAQMRLALRQGGAALPEAPDRVVYHMTNEDNRLVQEQQVSNAELQMLFTEAGPARKGSPPYAGRNSFSQKRAEPQLPAGQNEDLYVPTLLRRKQRKR